MKIKASLIVLAVLATPGFALAQGCSKGEDKITASSCAAGMVWDAVKESCITPTNS